MADIDMSENINDNIKEDFNGNIEESNRGGIGENIEESNKGGIGENIEESNKESIDENIENDVEIDLNSDIENDMCKGIDSSISNDVEKNIKDSVGRKKRIKLIISYDGTNYCGWQTQINGITVEEVINRELSRLLKEEIFVIGASRTDSGVHALGNVAVFDTYSRIPPEKMSFALNQRLPEDIRIEDSCEVSSDFHPRYCDSIKTYEYRILNRRFNIPVLRLYTHFVYMKLNVEKMKIAAYYIIGEHDFKSFCSARTQVASTVRTVYSLDINKNQDIISIRISGNGFLYNMVRIIVGTLIKVGLGVYPPEHVKEILDACNRDAAGPKVPAKGLTLIGIEYK